MDTIKIPQKERKTERIFILVTPKERERIRKICTEKKTTQTDLIRFALKQIIDF